ncbi:inner nuclear membrane protein Man1-like [Mytilus trossulus]|uniref:inner nuclear membrane protein Man1-like n=1 Tax=Mytilus trossulus TaxID=6551 RepID=UPI003005B4B8
MADKLTDAEIADELRKFGEQVKVPIDRKKRPLLLKKLNHYRAKERAATQPKKSSPSRKKQPAEFSSEESAEEDNEADSTFGKIFGRAKKAPSSPFYSNTNTIEISPSSSKDDPKLKRNTRRSFLSKDVNSSENKSKMYPDLSELSISSDSNSKNSSLNRSTLEYSYEQEFTDSDPDESTYEVVNKSVNTTFIYDNQDEEPTLHQTRSTPHRGTPNRKSGNTPNSVLVQRQKKNKANMNHVNKLPKEEPEEPLEDAFQTTEKVTETSSSYVSSILVLLVAIFFLSISLTYVYLRRDYLFHTESESGLIVPWSTKFGEDKTHDTDDILEIVRKISAYIHQQPLDPKADAKRVTKQVVKMKLEKDRVVKKDGVEFMKALHLILANPVWSIRLLKEDGQPIVYTPDSEDEDAVEKAAYLEADRDKSLLERLRDSAYRIFVGFVLLLSCIIAGVIGLLILRFYNKSKEEEQKRVYNMVEQIIDVIKDNFEASEGESNVPSFMAIQHVRDQLLPIAKRKKLLPTWEKAVKFIEANESRIRVESQSIQGEEFLVWKWLPTISNGGKVWQGQAFSENNMSPSTSLHYGPTPCLKIRNMFDADMEIEEDWEQNVKDAILEKCRGITGILHIHVDDTSKEGCVYMKCGSCEVAYKVYKSLHGWWFDGRLVTVKYLRLELYHSRFPVSIRVTKSLKPSNNKMSSLSQPYHRSTLEMT